MTAATPTSAPPYTRACRYCGTEMENGYGGECPDCGWRVGLVAIGEVGGPAGSTYVQFVAERPPRFARGGLIMVLLACLIVLILGAQNSLGLVFLSLAALIVVGVVCRETRFGRVVWGLTPGIRVLARIVIGIGMVLAFCTVVGVILGSVTYRPNRSD